jgi:oligopeptidase A
MSDNPFLDPSLAIRWSVLTADQVVPAITAALERAAAAVDRISAQDAGPPTYANTFLALEAATEELGVAWGKVTHLQSVADSPAIREAHNTMLPQVSAFYAKIPLNAALWQRLKACAELPEVQALQGIHRRFIHETLADFRQAGADLPEERRKRLEEIQGELAQLTQKYSENVLDATNAWQVTVTDPARLAGIPAHALQLARKRAEAKGLGTAEKPAWCFTLHQPSQEPVMTYAEDESLRQECWTAAIAVGAEAPHDNTDLVKRILTLRSEKALILHHLHFADLVLQRRMARNGQRALAFIEDLQRRAAPAFTRECRELEAFRATRLGQPGGPLKAWEVGFWSEKLRRAQYDFDEEVLRAYLPMDRVIAGLFEVARRVFGLEITERPVVCRVGETNPAGPEDAVETWHPEVKFYEVRDARGRHVGSFYADWHPRESKRGGAWMGYLVTGGPRPDGTRAPHLGYICGNLTPPVDGKPALLTHREVETIFHEFGHLLHHLLGEVEIKSLNGVNVAWDFVELPSQILENWTWEREGLDLFARHHETGAVIPEEIFRKMTAARNFRSACGTMRQVQFAKMDLLLHTRTAEFIDGDLEAKARAAVEDCMIPTVPPGRTLVKRFGHLFSDPVGYAAGYYSYKWAEVLDADAFSRFKREGIFNARTGADFVTHILSRGNSEDPAELFRRFMGRDPDLQALLVRAGLAA